MAYRFNDNNRDTRQFLQDWLDNRDAKQKKKQESLFSQSLAMICYIIVAFFMMGFGIWQFTLFCFFFIFYKGFCIYRIWKKRQKENNTSFFHQICEEIEVDEEDEDEESSAYEEDYEQYEDYEEELYPRYKRTYGDYDEPD